MLFRIRQLLRVGRFKGWNSQAAGRDEVRFRRLTLVFGRNASGKSTLVRVCRAASDGDAAELQLDRTLSEAAPPEVTLEHDGGTCRFDGTNWVGPKPKALVFDKRFIEANVYVGQRSTKEHRKELLRIALGEDDVTYARELDNLTTRGRALANALNVHTARISSAAAAYRMTPEAFESLQPINDLSTALSDVQNRIKEAQVADEISKRLRPNALPAPPPLDFDKHRLLLSKDSTRIGDDAAARVRSHLDHRLGGTGETWLQRGLSHDDGHTCPYCAQPLEGVELVGLFRAWFDRSYDELIAQIDAGVSRIDDVLLWWRQVTAVGQGNLKAFPQWSDISQLPRPSLDSTQRKADLDHVASTLRFQLEAKRQNPMKASAPPDLERLTSVFERIRVAVDRYNGGIAEARARIEERISALSSLSMDALTKQRTQIEATAQRYSESIVEAVSEKARIEREQLEIKQEKEVADVLMKERTRGKLLTFATRVNHLLEALCADFQLEDLGTERTGGATGARFSLRIDAGSLEVSTPDSEERFARVLSDGDRSTLAFALFLLSLDDVPGLSEHVIILDDPMTSQDSQRSEATAEQVTKLVARTKQVIVLSHHAPFLHQVAYDWNRHERDIGHELVEVELDKRTKTLVAWSAADHLRSEHHRRIVELEAFVESPGPDRHAGRMQGAIRKVLEGHVRSTHPSLYDQSTSSLEAIIRRLKGDVLLLRKTGWSDEALAELDRLCAFGARGNHDGSGVSVEPPSPEEIRSMARRALNLIRRGFGAFDVGVTAEAKPLPSNNQR
jgi:wobble nucleotide-excising tRNase